MKKGGIFSVCLILFVISSFLVVAQEGEIYSLPLLAVQETLNGSFIGSTADLYLELKEGSGRVFLDTAPLTKVDTQVSTRYAKEIACEYFDLECDSHDFIYTIRATSNIIGGPSAGAAIAALTTIAVLDMSYDEKIAITGTINSGGIVGPVGGVKDKIKAASEKGLSKVLIPFGGLEMPEVNKSVSVIDDLNPFSAISSDSLSNLDVDVVEIGDLNELIMHLTGNELRQNGQNITVDEHYTTIMKQLDEKLCKRSTDLEQELFSFAKTTHDLDIQDIEKRKNSAKSSRDKGDYYSSASFCFGLNIQFQYELNKAHNLTPSQIEQEKSSLEHSIRVVEQRADNEVITTISDLQTTIVVKERLSEAQKLLSEMNESSDKNYVLAYAHERLYSAISWTQFYVMEGREFSVDDDALKESCYQKIAQGNERYQYAGIYLPVQRISYIQEKITDAQRYLEVGEYELCLVKASQAKAESSSILSSLGLTNATFQISLDRKMQAVEHLIVDQSNHGIFPILGYSYYSYANALKETEPYSALLYLEYALELSDFEVYFDEEKSLEFPKIMFSEPIQWFAIGFIIGGIIMWIVLHSLKSNSSKTKKNHFKKKK
jgi:uncharacterized protein